MTPTSAPGGAGATGSRTRILYSFPHPIGGPGIGTTALNQVRGLVRRGLRVTLCCTSVVDRSDPDLPDEIHETLVVAGRRIPHRAVGIDRAMTYHDRRTARLIKRRDEPFDIVHVWPLASVATLRAAESRQMVGLRESPNSYTAVAYETVAREAARLGLAVPKGASHHHDPDRLAREELEYDLASAVLAPSDAVQESFAQRRGGPPPILRHQYGFDPVGFPPPDAERDPGSPFVVAFVGRCDPRKGLHHGLAAWRRSGLAEQGGRFLVVGPWEKAYRHLLRDELSQGGVELLEFSDDVGGILRSADALVLPSVEEGSALVTYEAQASGCALLVSDAAGALMTDNVHGFIHHVGDVDTLSTQLLELANDSVLLNRMRAAVLDHRGGLTWDAAAARLELAYRTALSRR